MHAFRFTHRRLRHTVWVTLLAWIFALSAGVANACVLGITDPATAAPASHMTGDRGHAGHEAHSGSNQGHDPGNGGCQKFCDDESSVVTKSPSSGSDSGAAMAVGVECSIFLLPRQSHATAQLLDRPRADGPALVIRFLRLTL